MPKTVVLGGLDHHVYYLHDGEVDNHDLTIAIQTALAETGVAKNNSSVSKINLFPNPVTSEAGFLSYNITQPVPITVDVCDIFGATVKSYAIGNENSGKHEVAIDLSMLSNGVYFIHLIAGDASQTVKFVVAE